MLSDKQKRFLVYCDKERSKPIDVNDDSQVFKAIVLSLFEMYLISKDRIDKRKTALMIYRLRDDLKKRVKLWHLIDSKEEFAQLVKEEIEISSKPSLLAQERRHQMRGDFALTSEEWLEVVRYFDGVCAYCEKELKLTYDHFHPFSKGGDFMRGNVLPACQRCNSSKNANDFEPWYKKQSFYSEERMSKIKGYVESNKQMALLI